MTLILPISMSHHILLGRNMFLTGQDKLYLCALFISSKTHKKMSPIYGVRLTHNLYGFYTHPAVFVQARRISLPANWVFFFSNTCDISLLSTTVLIFLHFIMINPKGSWDGNTDTTPDSRRGRTGSRFDSIWQHQLLLPYKFGYGTQMKDECFSK